MKKFFGYIKTVIIHKWWVFYYACALGIPWRGFLHDFSKLSPCELFENVKYYDGKQSPVINCKSQKGYSKAWLHHRGRNRHHYEYWYDNLDAGGRPIIMPYKETIEMLCDYFAAGRTYQKKNFSYLSEWQWWLNKKHEIGAMHLVQKLFITQALAHAAGNNTLPSKKTLKEYYDRIREAYENTN